MRKGPSPGCMEEGREPESLTFLKQLSMHLSMCKLLSPISRGIWSRPLMSLLDIHTQSINHLAPPFPLRTQLSQVCCESPIIHLLSKFQDFVAAGSSAALFCPCELLFFLLCHLVKHEREQKLSGAFTPPSLSGSFLNCPLTPLSVT